MRLQKYLADIGVASRRKAEEMIAAGRVAVNGRVVGIGEKVAEGDDVFVDGKIVKNKTNNVYILLNKPAGVISSVKDQFGRKTVVDLVGLGDLRLYPVGRLDYHSTGLILLTNDGDLAYKLTHPKHGLEKIYITRVAKPISEDDAKKFQTGLEIDGYKTRPAKIEIFGEYSQQAKITLNEGRNRQIRKMFEVLGNEVVSLRRISMGKIELGQLESGRYRHLTPSEVANLKL